MCGLIANCAVLFGIIIGTFVAMAFGKVSFAVVRRRDETEQWLVHLTDPDSSKPASRPRPSIDCANG